MAIQAPIIEKSARVVREQEKQMVRLEVFLGADPRAARKNVYFPFTLNAFVKCHEYAAT